MPPARARPTRHKGAAGNAAVQGGRRSHEHVARQLKIETEVAAGERRLVDFGGEVVIFCSDVDARSPDEDALAYPYTLTNANSDFALGTMGTNR